MANVYIGDLPLETSIENTDSLVGYIDGKASRITYEDLMSDVVHSEVQWTEIVNKPFEGIDTEVLAIASDNEGGTLLTFSSTVESRFTTIENDIDTVEGNITTLGNSISTTNTRVTTAETNINNLKTFTGYSNSMYANTSLRNEISSLASYNGYSLNDSTTPSSLTYNGSRDTNANLGSFLTELMRKVVGNVPTSSGSGSSTVWSWTYNTQNMLNSDYILNLKQNIFDNDWYAGRNYEVGAVVVYNGGLYKCITANYDSTFDSSHWTQISGGGGGGGGGSFSIVSGVFKHTDWRVIDNRQYAQSHNGQPNEFPYICKCCVMDVDSIVNPDNVMLVDQDNFDYNTPPPVLAQGIMMFDNDSQYANDEARGFYNRIIHTNADLRNMPVWSEDYDSDINPQSQRPFPWGDVWFDKGGWEGFTIYLDYREDTPAVDIPVALLVTN